MICFVVEDVFDYKFIVNILDKLSILSELREKGIGIRRILLHGKDRLESRKDLIKDLCYQGYRIIFVIDGDWNTEDTLDRVNKLISRIESELEYIGSGKKCSMDVVVIDSEIEEWVVIGICGKITYGEIC